MFSKLVEILSKKAKAYFKIKSFLYIIIKFNLFLNHLIYKLITFSLCILRSFSFPKESYNLAPISVISVATYLCAFKLANFAGN